MKQNAFEIIKKEKFIAIFRHIPQKDALLAAKALYRGGVRIFEITFDPKREDTIAEICGILSELREAFGEDVLLGAGTVLQSEWVDAAQEAGASFIVSPCTDAEVIAQTKKRGLLSVPGACTPSEIANAYKLGADIVKIFPILPNDEDYLKVVTSPLSHIPFLVTGGINPDTAAKFLATGAVAVAAGATLVTKELCEARAFDKMTELAEAHLCGLR